MSANNEPTLLDMIESLLRGKVGDLARLENIKLRLVDGKTIYNSDKMYVNLIFQDYRGTLPQTGKKTESEPQPSTSKNDYPEHTIRAVNTDQEEEQEQPTQTRPQNQSSRAWYLLPIFLWFLGGVISYACLRKEHPSRARKSLILGIGLSVPAVAVLVIAGLGGSAGDVASSGTDTVDLSHDEIKRDALSIPFESLENNPRQYVDEIIRFDGQVIQVVPNTFGNTYWVRIGTTAGLFVSSDVIWANYKAVTEEEKNWMEDLRRTNPFSEATSENTVMVYGIFKGLRDYENLLQGISTSPEVDVLIMERKDVSSTNSGAEIQETDRPSQATPVPIPPPPPATIPEPPPSVPQTTPVPIPAPPPSTIPEPIPQTAPTPIPPPPPATIPEPTSPAPQATPAPTPTPEPTSTKNEAECGRLLGKLFDLSLSDEEFAQVENDLKLYNCNN